MVLLIVAGLAGIFFGLYYKFLVLVPLTLAAALTCGAVAVVHGQNITATLFVIVIPVVGLQGGYVIGLTSRDLLSQFVARLNPLQSKRI
jgi:hypothetical protein